MLRFATFFFWIAVSLAQHLSPPFIRQYQYGGSGNETVQGVAVDQGGSIWIAGSTTSFDLPLVSPIQTANSGTELVFSPDDGITWQPLVNLPPSSHPFQNPLVLAAASTDSAASWTRSALPVPQGASFGGLSYNFAFDAIYGVIYGPELICTNAGCSIGTQKTTNGGLSWTHVTTPIADAGPVVADPKRPGYLYLIDFPNAAPAGVFYRSIDGGGTWRSFAFPGRQSGPLAIDPSNPDIILAGSFRSVDDGATWTPTTVSRNISAVFASGGRGVVFGTAPISSDVFLAKYRPGRRTPAFATYFGGMGTETVASLKIDRAGNVWVMGTTDSYGLPISSGAFPRNVSAASNLFLAEFSSSGQLLYCTYLGSSGSDRGVGMALAIDGSVWISGNTDALDFPITGGAIPGSCNCAVPGHAFVSHIQPSDASRLLFSAYVGTRFELAGGIAIDQSGNVLLTGTTGSPDFPVIGGAIRATSPPGDLARVYLVKLDSSGQILYSTYLGGTTPVANVGDQIGVGVGVDGSGNVVLAGYTAMTDFPTTPGAYQTNLHSSCTSPAFTYNFAEYLFDDVFVMKLSPDGRNLLYSTLLGGGCFDRLSDLAVSSEGVAYVTGETNSSDFPTQNFPPFQPLSPPDSGGYRSFVSAVDPSGSKLVFSTYLLAGANPVLGLGNGGELLVAGAEGSGAQSVSSPVTPGQAAPKIDGYLLLIENSIPGKAPNRVHLGTREP